ncbi:MAG: chemotaxis protein CheX [bacterium]
MKKDIALLHSALISAISKTMEHMAFMEIEVEKKQLNPLIWEENILWALLPLQKPFTGALSLEVSEEFGKFITEEVYGEGEDKQFSDHAVQDVLAEVLNTIGGRFLNKLAPLAEEIKIGVPRTGKGQIPEMAAKVASVIVNVDGNYFTTTIAGKDFKNLSKEDLKL